MTDVVRWSNPARVLRFAAVGATGLAVNTAVLVVGKEFVGLHYLAAAIVATQASTLWNYAGTDRWVFAGRSGGSGLRRLGLFALFNNLAFVVRGPAIWLLVNGLSLNYAIANLITLGCLVLGRFAVADRVIWQRRPAPESWSP